MNAPIVLFVYNRPVHTRKTLESLARNYLSKSSELYVFSDGPKEMSSREQNEEIDETREIVKERMWCGKVTLIEGKRNVGVDKSIINGVTKIVNKFGKVIVLEDDLLLSKHFLRYMNNALNRFEKEKRVMQISGYLFPIVPATNNDALFLPFTTSWGWATWKRSWSYFDFSAKGIKMLDNSKELRYKFDLKGSYPYYRMLKSQQRDGIRTWDICFYLNVFLNNGLVLHPKKTLVWNNGFDRSAVHTKYGMCQNKIDDSFYVRDFPENFIVKDRDMKNISSFLKRQNNIFIRGSRMIMSKIMPI